MKYPAMGNHHMSARIGPTMRRLARATLVVAVLAAAACVSRPEFVHDAYDRGSSDRLFREALSHLDDNYINRIDLRAVSVAGMNGLSELDPSVSASAGPGGGYSVRAGSAKATRFDAPDDRDSDAWAALLSDAVATARQGSETLRNADPDAVYTAVLTGVTATLDDFSRYEPPKRANESRARREGYGGIGVTIRDEDGDTVVQEVMPKTPAARAGLQPGDIITHADGVDLRTLAREDRAERLRGPIGVVVAISIQRKGVDPFTVKVERAEIVPVTVYFESDKGLPRFRLSSFSRDTAATLAKSIETADRATPGGLKAIVLDLRGNPGGYLTQAIEVADLFLSDGLVVATRGRHPSSSSAYRARAGEIAKDKPIVILIDGRSASASELLAAALVDAGRAVAVGSVTYGKGSIQNLEELANGGELIITWSRMHAPSGYLLDGLGVRPTVCTANGGRVDALVAAARAQARSDAESWRTYRAPDATLAESLRASCPKVEGGGDIDIDVARALLRSQTAYEAALTPAPDRGKHASGSRRPGVSG